VTLTLRQHAARALEILSTDGVRSSTPPKGIMVPRAKRKAWMRNPKRPPGRTDVWGKQRDDALSVMMLCEAYDRTGYMLEWLTASDETASGVWHSIPDKVICFACRVKRLRATVNGRRRCPRCGRKMLTYVGIVCADIKLVEVALRKGGVGVE